MPNALIAILPCNDLDASEAFYARLGFNRHDSDIGTYRILSHDGGGEVHLVAAADGWLIAGRNPFGLYFYTEAVDELAARLGIKPEDKPWGMYEFSLSDPDQTLVRVGWPSRLRIPHSR
jgi:catechol 2,3-dioxygenase-like lactoylglutathione lyase family enzyme